MEEKKNFNFILSRNSVVFLKRKGINLIQFYKKKIKKFFLKDLIICILLLIDKNFF